MAIPDKTKNVHPRLVISAALEALLVATTMSHANKRTTEVRTAVATFELIPVTLADSARIAVAAAKSADNIDQASQFINRHDYLQAAMTRQR